MEKETRVKLYGAVNRDAAKLRGSSSGGVFCELARAFIEGGGIVYGARYDVERHIVRHVGVSAEGLIPSIMKSKYVQSDVTGSFREAREQLKAKKAVLFCGTPCQIYGIRQFMRNIDTSRLYTVSFFCHGMTSGKLWREYTEYLEETFQSEIVYVNFRFKTEAVHNLFLHIVFQNGREYFAPYDCDPYYSAFSSKNSLIPACGQCRFRDWHLEDITLGDCRPEELKTEMSYKYASIVTLNSRKGEELFERVKQSFQLTEDVDATELEKRYSTEEAGNGEQRQLFRQIYQREGIKGVARAFCEEEKGGRDWPRVYNPDKKSIVMGAGSYGRLAAVLIGEDNIAFYADNDPEKSGKYLNGKEVILWRELRRLSETGEYNIVAAVSKNYIKDMIDQFEECGVEEYSILIDLMRAGYLHSGSGPV